MSGTNETSETGETGGTGGTGERPRYTGLWHGGPWVGAEGWEPSAWANRIRQGRAIGFTSVWHGHQFSDEECRRLLNGETIELKDVPRTRPDDPYVQVRLGEYVYRHSRRCGIMASNRADQHPPIPQRVMGHHISADERRILKNGGVVPVKGLTNTFSMRLASGQLILRDDEHGKGHVSIENLVPAPDERH